MASKTSFSAACLLVLVVANTFLAGQVAACGSCKPPRHSPPPPAPVTPTPGTPCPPPPSSSGTCPRDTLKLAACANVKGLVSVGLGHPPSGGDSCCSLLDGLADLEAAVCLCTALKANVLGIVVNIPIKLSIILNYCSKTAPADFLCA